LQRESRKKTNSSSEMSTGQDWIGLDQDWSQFWRIRIGSDCNCFENWRIRTGSDWENLRCFDVIILNISKILVVIRFCRFAKLQCIFFHQWQKLCWEYFAIRTISTIAHI